MKAYLHNQPAARSSEDEASTALAPRRRDVGASAAVPGPAAKAVEAASRAPGRSGSPAVAPGAALGRSGWPPAVPCRAAAARRARPRPRRPAPSKRERERDRFRCNDVRADRGPGPAVNHACWSTRTPRAASSSRSSSRRKFRSAWARAHPELVPRCLARSFWGTGSSVDTAPAQRALLVQPARAVEIIRYHT